MFCIGRHVGRHTAALQNNSQNQFLLVYCQTFDSYAQICCKHYQNIIFSTFSLTCKCKICVQKWVIHSFTYHILVTSPATNSLILRKQSRFEKTKSLLFCLRYDPLIVLRRQNHMTFIFLKTTSHDLLVQMAHC